MPVTATSTSVMTQRIARVIRVASHRLYLNTHVTVAGVYNCRVTAGTKPALYSSHAFGDGVDLMLPQEEIGNEKVLEGIAKRMIADATRPTFANFGKPTKAFHIIWNKKQWIRGVGITDYPGVAHLNHVHVACSGSTAQKPLCAGGTNYDVPYLNGSRGYAKP